MRYALIHRLSTVLIKWVIKFVLGVITEAGFGFERKFGISWFGFERKFSKSWFGFERKFSKSWFGFERKFGISWFGFENIMYLCIR